MCPYQADLVKKAKSAGLLQHLPPGPKTPILDPTNPNVQKYNPSVAAAVSAAFEAQKATSSTKKRQAVLPQTSKESWTATTPEKGNVLNKPVSWVGKIDLHQKAGADAGIKLYAGKKRMFKGHRWERLKDSRERKQAILMRDMAERIRVYKEVSFPALFSSTLSCWLTYLWQRDTVLQEETTQSSQTAQELSQGWQDTLLIYVTPRNIMFSFLLSSRYLSVV